MMNPEALLTGAAKKFVARDFDGAEQDYRTVLAFVEGELKRPQTEAAKQELTGQQARATAGIQRARAARATGTGPLSDRVALLRGQLPQAQTDERRLVVLHQLREIAREGVPSAEELKQYQDLLSTLAQQILIKTRQALADDDLTRAVAIFEGQALFQVAGTPDERAVVERVMAALKATANWQAEAPQIVTQITNRQRSASGPPPPVSTPMPHSASSPPLPVSTPMPLVDPAIPPVASITDASARRAEELVAEAEAYLRRPTANNYKDAYARLDQALQQSGLSPARRGEIQTRLATVGRDYADFRERFGQLTTARQLENIELELIAARVLQNKGIEVGPDREDLTDLISTKLEQLRKRLVRVAGEQAATADHLVEDGQNYLDAGALKEAVARYERVIGLLQGQEIKVVGTAPTAEQTTAIAGFQSRLLEYPEITDAIKTYEARREAIRRLPELLERALPTYKQAEQLYNEGRYSEALKQIERMRGIIGNRFQSSQFDELEGYVRKAFEAQIAAKIQNYLDSASIALSRDDVVGVTTAIEAARAVEPQFTSERLDTLRAQANELIKQVGQGEEAITANLAAAQVALAEGKFDVAIQKVRTLLIRRPNHAQARKLLDEAIYQQVSNVINEADQLTDRSPLEALNKVYPQLSTLADKAREHSDTAVRVALDERVKETITRTGRRIAQQRKAAEDTSQLNAALSEFERYLKANLLEEAARSVRQMRLLTSSDPQVQRAEADLKTTWSAKRRRQAQDFLAENPPQFEAALTELDALEKLAPGDSQLAPLRQKAELLKAMSAAQMAFERGDFAATLTILRATTADTSESLDLLRKARQREVQRLTGLEQWAEVLVLLRDVDAAEESMPGLFRRATGEQALRQAEEHLRLKLFDQCEQALAQVEQQRLDDLSKHAAEIRGRLEATRTIYRRVETFVQTAQGHERQFATSQNREALLAAIKQLDQALTDSELLPGDKQREQIQQQRDGYQRRYQELSTTERRRLLNAGNQSLSADQIVEAREAFRAVHALTPSGHDPEATDGLQRTQRRFDELRARAVTEVALMLNLNSGGQRGVAPSAIRQKISEIEALRKIDPDQVDVRLNEVMTDLQEAEQLCRQAEEALNAARQRWASLRSKTLSSETLETREPELDLERGIKIFNSRTYIHADLDRTNIESLTNRFEKDVKDLREANRFSLALRQGLEREPRNMDELIRHFEQLRAVEESLYQMTLIMIDRDRVASVTRPGTSAERYPRQYRFMRSLHEQIESLRRAELTVPDLTALRQIMVQRSQIEELIGRLDREKRFTA